MRSFKFLIWNLVLPVAWLTDMIARGVSYCHLGMAYTYMLSAPSKLASCQNLWLTAKLLQRAASKLQQPDGSSACSAAPRAAQLAWEPDRSELSEEGLWPTDSRGPHAIGYHRMSQHKNVVLKWGVPLLSTSSLTLCFR